MFIKHATASNGQRTSKTEKRNRGTVTQKLIIDPSTSQQNTYYRGFLISVL